MAVTMTDVAQAARVSVTTVSHVVNGTRPVSAPTRERVLAAMERLGYTSPTAQRSLAAGSTVTIGVAVPLSVNAFYQEVIGGIEGEAHRHGFTVLVADTADDPCRERAVTANLVAHHVQGMLASPTSGWGEGGGRVVRDHQMPCVLVDRLQDPAFDQVGTENERGAHRLVEHLVGLGHRRIACIAGRAGLTTTRERVAGYRSAMALGGVDVEESSIVDGESTERGGRAALRRLMREPHPPTAVFVANDAMTMGVLRAARDLGVGIPDDLALVCFDDPPWGDLVHPSLTAVAQPAHAVGARAVQMLAARFTEPMSPTRTLRLEGEIAHRDSCGCGRV